MSVITHPRLIGCNSFPISSVFRTVEAIKRVQTSKPYKYGFYLIYSEELH